MAFYPVAPLPDTHSRQVAQTIRMPSTALLTIDSEDRYSGYSVARSLPTSPYNFSINKMESLMPGFMTRIGVSEVVFPWTVPNINIKTRSINFVYSRSGSIVTVATIGLPVGFYTPAQLATLMQNAIIQTVQPSIDISGFTFQYGQTIRDASNVILAGDIPAFTYATNVITDTIYFTPMPPNTTDYPYSDQTKQLFDVLGFTTAQLPSTAYPLGKSKGNGIYTLCQAIRYVDLVCNQLTNSQSQKDQTSQTVARDMLCRIYLGSGSGDGQSTIEPGQSTFCPPGCAPMVIYRNFTMPKQIQWIPNQNIPGYLQFQVYDDAGDLLDASLTIPGGMGIGSTSGPVVGQASDWSMTMLVSEV